MKTELETIDLDPGEQNELLFKVKIEGIDPAPAKVRLVCEGKNGVSYMFAGKPESDNVVQFMLPAMSDVMKEEIYESRVEVLIENKYFVPIEFNVKFKKQVRVVAESIQRIERKTTAPAATVTAAPLTSSALRDRYLSKKR